MISRKVVCGRNFMKRSSFFTSGLRRWLRPKGTTENSPAFQRRVRLTKNITSTGGATESPATILSAAPSGLMFLLLIPAVETAGFDAIKITSPGGATESPATILSAAPPGLDCFGLLPAVETAGYSHTRLWCWVAKFHPAVSRMISRSGVRGRNFTKCSSFFTSGLRRRISSNSGALVAPKPFGVGG